MLRVIKIKDKVNNPVWVPALGQVPHQVLKQISYPVYIQVKRQIWDQIKKELNANTN